MELGILAGMEIQSDSDLERAGEAVLNKGLRRLFVSLGAEGCLYMDDTGTVLRRKLRPANGQCLRRGRFLCCRYAVRHAPWL